MKQKERLRQRDRGAHRRGYSGAQERIQERRGARREGVCTANIFKLGSKNLQILQKTVKFTKVSSNVRGRTGVMVGSLEFKGWEVNIPPKI